MSPATVIIIVLAIYLLGMLAIGWISRKYTDTMGDFLTAAKQGTLVLVTGSFIGAHIGNGVVVGGAEYGHIYGIGGIWFGVGAAFSYFLFAAVMSRAVYRGGYITISDMLDDRYGSKVASTLVAFLNAGSQIVTLGGQIMAGQRLFEYIGLNGTLGALITTAVVIIYSSMGGMYGVLLTDVIQSATIIICMVIAMFYIGGQGGFEVILNNLSAENFELIPFDLETFVMMFVPTMLLGLVSAGSFMRTATCKDERVAVRAPLLGGLVILPVVILPVLLGMYGHALFPDSASNTIIFRVLMEALPPVLSGLMVAAICAAVMSTCDTALLQITSNFTSDFYKKIVNPNASEKTLKNASVAVTALSGVFALLVSLQFTSIISMLSMSYTLMTAGSLAMVVGGLFWKRATSQGAVASFVVGMLFVVLNKTGVLPLPYASIFPILPSAIALVVVSLMTKPAAVANDEK